ncbi:MAG: histidine kinase [Bacteroidales bacterium]|nr:histidine kinase [Bacteroidales bacterium]MBK8882599.1 histidine kinase [Bacteroidales bacterium]
MKHPVLSNKVRLIVWWLVWLFLALGQSLLFYYAYGKFTYIGIVDSLTSLIIYSGIAISLWYPFSFFNTGEVRPATLISNLIISGAISITIWVLITKYIVLLVLPENTDYLAYWEATFPYRIGTGVFIYGLVVLSYFLFISLTNLSEKNAKEARLESLVKETELKMLRSQINPHFLFNSLNSISSLTITDPEKAREMVIKLSEFMRYALSRKDEQPVSLQNELENLRLYLEIEKVRFGEKLITEENIEHACLEFNIPVMLLQPLYENAVKHGVYESTESVRIITHVRFIDGFFEISISNNYDPAPSLKKGTGTGLLNVSRRLELFYGNKGSMKTSKENGIYTVTLYLPIDYK